MGTERLRRSAIRLADHTGATHSETEVAEPAPVAPFFPGLQVGRADDPMEAAADQLADQALARLAVSASSVVGGSDSSSAGDSASAGDSDSGSAGPVRRSATPVGHEGGALDAETAGAIDAQRAGGHGLPNGVRGRLEAGFGADLSRVRVHTGDSAASVSSAVSARAFTTGNDIFFGHGEYRPETAGGEQVLAHEVAHVLQNGGASGAPLQRWPGDKKKKKGKKADDAVDAGPDDATGTATTTVVPTTPPDVAGNEGLSPVAAQAFTAAKALNTNYSDSEEAISAWVPQGDQKKIADFGGSIQKTKGDADKLSLKNLLRAYLMQAYAVVIADKIDKPTTTSSGTAFRALTKDERKRMSSRYLAITLGNRDKWAGLLEKGPYHPETQTFLKDEGFGAAIPRTPDQKATDGGGPRIDVRATFIGGKILGAPRRMHLFIIYTSSDGEQFFFRGGPDEDDYTVCDTGPFDSGIVDWDPSAPSITVLKGEKAKLKFDGLIEAAGHIDAMKVPYVAAEPDLNAGGLGGLEAFVNGENCNSVAYTLLKRAGIPQKKPSGLHPGWGHILGEARKEGAQKLPPKEATSGETSKLNGSATKTVQVFADRNMKEKLVTLPADADVEYLTESGGLAKIKFGPKGVIGWIDGGQVKKPKPKGRYLWIGGKRDQMAFIQDGSMHTIAYPVTGDEMLVLDDDFNVGDRTLVHVQWHDDSNNVHDGYLDGTRLTDTDPKKGGGASSSDSSDDSSSESSEAPKGKNAKQPVKGKAVPQKPEPKAVVQPAPKAIKVNLDDTESGSESDEEADHKPVTARFKTDKSLPLFEGNGKVHKYKGTNGAIEVGANGTTKGLVDGRLLVEFELDGKWFWTTEAEWKRAFGQNYPAR